MAGVGRIAKGPIWEPAVISNFSQALNWDGGSPPTFPSRGKDSGANVAEGSSVFLQLVDVVTEDGSCFSRALIHAVCNALEV
jgi:hypothetical protein